jgi:hypothetical protein
MINHFYEEGITMDVVGIEDVVKITKAVVKTVQRSSRQ